MSVVNGDLGGSEGRDESLDIFDRSLPIMIVQNVRFQKLQEQN